MVNESQNVHYFPDQTHAAESYITKPYEHITISVTCFEKSSQNSICSLLCARTVSL